MTYTRFSKFFEKSLPFARFFFNTSSTDGWQKDWEMHLLTEKLAIAFVSLAVFPNTSLTEKS